MRILTIHFALQLVKSSGLDLNGCIASIVERYGKSRVLYVTTEVWLGSWNKSYMLVNPRENMSFLGSLESQDFYVLHCQKLSHIEAFLAAARESIGWKSQVKTLLVTSPLQDVFELSWKYYLSNVLAIDKGLNLYSYYPITKGKCRIIRPVFVGRCMANGVYQESKTRQFKGCNFKTSFNKEPPWQIDWYSKGYPGFFTKINQEMQASLGYNLEVLSNFTDTGHGVLFPNGSCTGRFGDLLNGNLDYYLSNIANGTYSNKFDYVPHYFNNHYYFWAPKANSSNTWKNVFKIYSQKVWVALGATMAGIVLSCSFLLKTELGNFSSFAYLTLVTWRIAFTVNDALPKKAQFKLLLFLWTIATYILSSLYQGKMNTFLFLPNYDHQIASVEEILDSGLQYGGSYFVKDIYANLGTDLSRRISERFVLCVGLNVVCVDRVVEKGDFVVVKDTHSVAYFWSRYLDEVGKPKLFWFPSGLHTVFVVYMRKGHPLKQALNDVNLRFLQSGLINKWDEYSSVKLFAIAKGNIRKLSLEHLLAVFVMLIVGLSVAIVVFMYEYCHSKTSL